MHTQPSPAARSAERPACADRQSLLIRMVVEELVRPIRGNGLPAVQAAVSRLYFEGGAVFSAAAAKHTDPAKTARNRQYRPHGPRQQRGLAGVRPHWPWSSRHSARPWTAASASPGSQRPQVSGFLDGIDQIALSAVDYLH